MSECKPIQQARFILCLLLLMCSTPALRAYDFEVDSIYNETLASGEVKETTVRFFYNKLSDTEVELTREKEDASGSYAGNIIVPAKVTNDGVTYDVTGIAASTFRGCSRLTSVTMYGVKTIGRQAFSACDALSAIQLPEGLTYIGEEAFSHCASLTSISLPSSLKSISNWTFYYCGNLTSVTIPEGVTSIGSEAFFACRALASVTIPESVTSIDNGVFSWCTSLTSVDIPNAVTNIGDGAFSYCYGLTSIDFPESITSIGDGAFRNTSLDSIILPRNLTTIGNAAFKDCTFLTAVTIPSRVTSIGMKAFENCDALKSIISQIETPFAISDDVFYSWWNLYDSATLYCPDPEAYSTTGGWENFTDIRDISRGTTTAIRTATGEEEGSTAVYDLNGRRVEKLAKGLYIINGKKVLVK